MCGHSKGGNLAVYAAAKSPKQARIEKVYNFDGPGLNAAASGSEGYRAVEGRVETYLPQFALVGILLEQAEEYFVVKSDGSGVRQHDPFTWQVLPDGFELVEQLSRRSLYADRVLGDWLDSMSVGQRRTLVEALYELVEATGARTVGELAEHWRESGLAMLGALGDLDLRTRLNLYIALGKLLRSAVRGIGEESPARKPFRAGQSHFRLEKA